MSTWHPVRYNKAGITEHLWVAQALPSTIAFRGATSLTKCIARSELNSPDTVWLLSVAPSLRMDGTAQKKQVRRGRWSQLRVSSLFFSRKTKTINDYSGKDLHGVLWKEREKIFGLITRKGAWMEKREGRKWVFSNSSLSYFTLLPPGGAISLPSIFHLLIYQGSFSYMFISFSYTHIWKSFSYIYVSSLFTLPCPFPVWFFSRVLNPISVL